MQNLQANPNGEWNYECAVLNKSTGKVEINKFMWRDDAMDLAIEKEKEPNAKEKYQVVVRMSQSYKERLQKILDDMEKEIKSIEAKEYKTKADQERLEYLNDECGVVGGKFFE